MPKVKKQRNAKMSKVDQGIVIILDIGRDVSTPEENNQKSFFAEARECAAKIIESQIMNQEKNLLGIVLLGSENTKNNKAEQVGESGAFRSIELLHNLQPPNWQMIRSFPEIATNSRGDWIAALNVALDQFKNGISGVKIVSKNIVLMTNFLCPTKFASNDIEQMLSELQEDNFQIDCLGQDIYNENYESNDIKLARRFLTVTNGVEKPFHDTMQYLLFHKKKLTKPKVEDFDLHIGPNIKIPVSTCIRIQDKPIGPKWGNSVKDRVTSEASTSEGIMKHKEHVNTNKQTVVNKDNIIKGYNYGQAVIPISECDKTMPYESVAKTLSIYGFTDATKVNWQTLCGDGLQSIFGRNGNKKAQNTVRCLVECLHELKLVGLVRRVYNNGNAPKMFALMPVIDTNNFICLSMAEVCFKEDIKNITFPSPNLKKFACLDEQVNAFKDLIHAMDLTKAYDESFDEAEAFPTAETVCPSAQYILDCIAFRAMNPGKPLPQPRDEIMMLFKKPPLIEKRSHDPLAKLKLLFTLNEVEVKTRKKGHNIQSDNIPMKLTDDPITNDESNGNVADAPKIEMPKKTNEVTRIGTINPIEDYKALSNNDKKLSDLAPDMTDAIESLVYYNIDGNYNKAIDAMSFFRSECVKAEPTHYNSLLQKFRTALVDRKKQEVIDLITDRQISFILKGENPLSTYETQDGHDDSQAYENDTIPNSTDLNLPSTVNDMFDEM